MSNKTILGLILELNPPHNGHRYFIDKAKELVNPDLTIAIISTSFSMRGDIMVLDKFTKAKIALEMGVDLLLELPFLGSNGSADYFARNSINILNSFGITDLVFGAELDDTNKLEKLANIIDSSSYNQNIKLFLDQGLSYSTSCNKALALEINDLDLINNFSLPNNTLGIQYIRSIKSINPNIKYHTIKRIDNNYFDVTTTGIISSATSIRECLKNNNNVDGLVFNGKQKIDFINQDVAYNNLFKILKYNLLINSISFNLILGISEGIENRLINIIKESSSYDEFINKVATKRYPANKIKRILLNIILGIQENDNLCYNYYRVLAFNINGEKYLNTLPKEIKKSIITSFKNVNNNIADIELKVTNLFGLITNNESLYLNEFNIPIRSEENDS